MSKFLRVWHPLHVSFSFFIKVYISKIFFYIHSLVEVKIVIFAKDFEFKFIL